MKKLKEKITKMPAMTKKMIAGSLVLTTALGLGLGLGLRPQPTHAEARIAKIDFNYLKEEIATLLDMEANDWLVVNRLPNRDEFVQYSEFEYRYTNRERNYLLSFSLEKSVMILTKIKGKNQFEVSSQDKTEEEFLLAIESHLMQKPAEANLMIQGDLAQTEWEIARNFLLKVASQHNIVVPQIVVAHAWNDNGFVFEFLINGVQNEYAYKRVSIAVFKWSHQTELNAYSVRFWKNAIYGDFEGIAGTDYVIAHDSSDVITANKLISQWAKNMQHNAPFLLAKNWGVDVIENQLVFWRGKETLNRKLVLPFSLNKNEIIFNQQQALNFLKK